MTQRRLKLLGDRPEAGFTLSEVLIALAILGVIATFAIPKVLQAQQDQRHKAIAKESFATIVNAYQAYKLQNLSPTTIRTGDLTPYMNYAYVDTAAVIDDRAPAVLTSLDCSDPVRACLRLHNGSVLTYDPDVNFGGTGALNAIWFKLDPNGEYDGAASGRAINIWLYYSGRLTSFCCIETNTVYYNNGVATLRNPDQDPVWFDWD